MLDKNTFNKISINTEISSEHYCSTGRAGANLRVVVANVLVGLECIRSQNEHSKERRDRRGGAPQRFGPTRAGPRHKKEQGKNTKGHL
jgi:hypothetical protein